MEKLVKDNSDADRAGKLSSPISFKQSNDIPCLIALFKESMRLHPSVGLLMERHVPAQGVNIDGYFLKAGTIVGINPWVVNRNPEIFADPGEFRPERWLDASAQLKAMDNAWELNSVRALGSASDAIYLVSTGARAANRYNQGSR